MKVYLDPLLAESVPDGTFGGARPTREQRKAPAPRTPDPKAAEHYAALDAATSRRRPRTPTNDAEAPYAPVSAPPTPARPGTPPAPRTPATH
ncbi:hypothetical protein ACFXKX_23970 [Streptomyces scopuliridis]|uniref:hypothetical protein n=1 Tax=Streptomyces scopuliridis TaxID=452529 RepID=UPI0036ADEC81